MQTSFFGNWKNLPKEKCISIARGNPVWFHGRIYYPLAPTWEMIKRMTEAQYDQHYQEILSHLDARSVYNELGEDAILLCWEKPGQNCHRRMVAEWFEKELGVEVPEYGQAHLIPPE